MSHELRFIYTKDKHGQKRRAYLTKCPECGKEKQVQKSKLDRPRKCADCYHKQPRTEKEKQNISNTLKERSRLLAELSPTKKCPGCNRTKKRHLFVKNRSRGGGVSSLCKLCEKRYRAAKKADWKEADYAGWKAEALRSNWLARARLRGVDKEEVPTKVEIKEWLLSQLPWTCYYTGEALGTDIGVDHKVALARGGGYGLDNLVLVSKKLNMAKGVMSDAEFMELLCLTARWEDGGASILKRLAGSGRTFSKGKK